MLLSLFFITILSSLRVFLVGLEAFSFLSSSEEDEEEEEDSLSYSITFSVAKLVLGLRMEAFSC